MATTTKIGGLWSDQELDEEDFVLHNLGGDANNHWTQQVQWQPMVVTVPMAMDSEVRRYHDKLFLRRRLRRGGSTLETTTSADE